MLSARWFRFAAVLAALAVAACGDILVDLSQPRSPLRPAETCAAWCQRVLPELIDNFGFDPNVCLSTGSILAAGTDCGAGEDAFRDDLGVLADICGDGT